MRYKMTELQKLIKQVFTDYEYDDENFITTPHIENLEKILLQKATEMQTNPVENRVIPQGELLPCPFCGGEPEVYRADKSLVVFCKECHCQTEDQYYNAMGNKHIILWNKRASRERRTG